MQIYSRILGGLGSQKKSNFQLFLSYEGESKIPIFKKNSCQRLNILFCFFVVHSMMSLINKSAQEMLFSSSS